ncbi:MAG: hypothetical protein ACR2HS_06550 [Gammaproteobacteria bacterium]
MQFISFLLGIIICYLADLIFKLIINLFSKKLNQELNAFNDVNNYDVNNSDITKITNIKIKNIIKKLYLAEFVKLIFFSISLFLIFKHLQLLSIEPKIFIISVLIYLIFNFTKNLLKLIL